MGVVVERDDAGKGCLGQGKQKHVIN